MDTLIRDDVPQHNRQAADWASVGDATIEQVMAGLDFERSPAREVDWFRQRLATVLNRNAPIIGRAITNSSDVETKIVSASVAEVITCDAPGLRLLNWPLRPYHDISIQVLTLGALVDQLASVLAVSRRVCIEKLISDVPGSRPLLIIAGREALATGDAAAAAERAHAALALESSCPQAQRLLFDAHLKLREETATSTTEIALDDLSDRFCFMPFEYLEFLSLPDAGGRKFGSQAFSCACAGWQPYPIGDLASAATPEMIWNSEAAREIRRSIHDGSFKYCSRTLCPYIVGGTLPRRSDVQDPRLRHIIDSGSDYVPAAPKHIQLSHDNSCNLACPSCRTDIIVAKSSERERFREQAERILLPLLSNVDGFACITGMGDPFGSKHYRWLIGQLNRQEYPSLKLDLVTNAQLLTRSEWEQLGSARELVSYIRVSIDAAERETYEDVRRPGKWARLMENLEFISELRTSKSIDLFQICFVVQAANFRQMPDFVRLGQRLGVDSIIFQKLWNFGSFPEETFRANDVSNPAHPLHDQFLQILEDPVLRASQVSMFNVARHVSR